MPWWKRLRIRLPSVFGARVILDETVIGIAALMIVSRGQFGIGRAIGLLLLISTHEFGHLIAGLIYRQRPRVIRIGLFGGYCAFYDSVVHLPVILAGLLTNFGWLVATITIEWTLGPLESQLALGAYQALVYFNLALIAYNCLPIGHSDAHLALAYFRGQLHHPRPTIPRIKKSQNHRLQRRPRKSDS
ncbi:hypothetical protein Poly51_62730 [Rubripirellula tenax]|uniref:Peptidase family M50 n=1 Tax=Rubripirellula tenax TaxID=2528015 RepID=A0A5C6E402_9BACT|nr:hypothetical protein Poly51_62730 [Rubripirellula tenax]